MSLNTQLPIKVIPVKGLHFFNWCIKLLFSIALFTHNENSILALIPMIRDMKIIWVRKMLVNKLGAAFI